MGGWEDFPKGLGPLRAVGAGCGVPASLCRRRTAIAGFLQKCLLRSVFRGDSSGGLALSSHRGWQVARVCAVLVLASSNQFEPECPLVTEGVPAGSSVESPSFRSLFPMKEIYQGHSSSWRSCHGKGGLLRNHPSASVLVFHPAPGGAGSQPRPGIAVATLM